MRALTCARSVAIEEIPDTMWSNRAVDPSSAGALWITSAIQTERAAAGRGSVRTRYTEAAPA